MNQLSINSKRWLQPSIASIYYAILYRRGIIYSGSKLFEKKGRLFLTDSLSPLEESERAQILSLLRLIDAVNREIALIDGHLAYLAKEREDVRLLLTIPGVSFLIAVGILAEIGDIHKPFPPSQRNFLVYLARSGFHSFTHFLKSTCHSYIRTLYGSSK